MKRITIIRARRAGRHLNFWLTLPVRLVLAAAIAAAGCFVGVLAMLGGVGHFTGGKR